MRIALLFPNNIFTSPYLKYFIQILEKEGVMYDVLIWDREDVTEKNTIAFKNKGTKNSAISKAIDFIAFRKFIKRRLQNTRYDRVIVFSCQLGILLSDYLISRYKKKYILDIRDHSITIPYFKNRFRKLVLNSYFTSISSPDFKEWLPKNGNYIVSHNIDIKLIEECLSIGFANKLFFKGDVISIDTIGQIKDFESDHIFVRQLKNDPRFKMKFIGFGSSADILKEYAKKNNIKNILFHGSYKKEEEEELLKNTDIINILISRNETNKGATLLSNRLYLSALLQIPCIVNSNTAQSRIIEKYKFGIIVDNYEDLPTKIMGFKKNFDKEKFVTNCYTFLSDVKKDYELFERKTTNFITENKAHVQG